MRRRTALLPVGVAAAAVAAFLLLRSGSWGPADATSTDANGDASPESPAQATPAPMSPEEARPGSLAARPRATTAPPRDHEDRIAGRVVDADRKPIADARVLDIPSTTGIAFDLDAVGRDGLLVSDAVTDAEGRFVVAARGDTPTHTLIARTAAGRFGVAPDVTLGGGAREVTIIVDGGYAMTGTVVDRDGKPVARATVRVDGLVDALHVRYEATTAADGRYRLDGLPVSAEGLFPDNPRFRALVEVTAEGFAPLLQRAERVIGSGVVAERDYVLSRGSTLEGTVVEAGTSKPVAGAQVVLWSIEGADRDPGLITEIPAAAFVSGWLDMSPATTSSGVSLPAAPRALAETTADSHGAFRFERVPGLGFHAIADPVNSRGFARSSRIGYATASAPGYARRSASVEAVAAGERVEVSLELPRAGAIEGRVVAPAGVDLTRARIGVATTSVNPPSFGLTEFADVDGSGRFTDTLPPVVLQRTRATSSVTRARSDGRFRIEDAAASADGDTVEMIAFVPSSIPGTTPELGATATVTVRAGKTSTVPDLVLAPLAVDPPATPPCATATVRVVDEGGRPIWGAHVRQPEWPGAKGVTGRDGVARLSGTPGGTITTNAAVWHAGFASILVPLEFSVDEREPVRVVLHPGHRVEGQVFDARGAPAVGAGVVADSARVSVESVLQFAPERKTFRLGSLVWRTLDDDLYPSGGTFTDREGRFVLDDLPSGPVHVAAVHYGAGGIGRTPPRGLAASVPEDSTGVRVVLSAADGPEPGAIAGVVRDAATSAPPRTLVVEVRLAGGGYFFASTADSRLVARPPGTGVQESIPSPGRLSFDGVPPGTHRLHVSSEGFAPRSLDVVVESGKTTEVGPIDLVRGVVVHGRLRRDDGTRFRSDAYVMATPVSVREAHGDVVARTAGLASDGRFELAGLSSGRWRVSTASPSDTSDDRIAADGMVLVVPPEATEVTWERVMTAACDLRVGSSDPRLPTREDATDEQKRFAAGCEVEVLDERGEVVAEQHGGFLRSDVSSVSRIVVPPGTYTVRTKVLGEATVEKRVTVEKAPARRDDDGGAPPPRRSTAIVTFGDTPAGSTGTCGQGKCG